MEIMKSIDGATIRESNRFFWIGGGFDPKAGRERITAGIVIDTKPGWVRLVNANTKRSRTWRKPEELFIKKENAIRAAFERGNL